MKRVRVIDSHTGGEPTRVVVSGGPDLGSGTVAERLDVFREQHDRFRSAVVNEPRGSDVLVGALLLEPTDPACAAGVIFFNNVGCLGMCGHGTIGLVVTLAHLGRIGAGEHRHRDAGRRRDGDAARGRRGLVGERAELSESAKAVTVEVPGIGRVTGDVAWGGNWFFSAQEQQAAFVGDGGERFAPGFVAEQDAGVVAVLRIESRSLDDGLGVDAQIFERCWRG